MNNGEPKARLLVTFVRVLLGCWCVVAATRVFACQRRVVPSAVVLVGAY